MSSGSKKHDGGLKALDVIIIVVMAVLIVLAGLWVYLHTQDEKEEPAEDITTQTQLEEQTPSVERTEDLQDAEQYLQDLDIEGDLNTKEFDETLTN